MNPSLHLRAAWLWMSLAFFALGSVRAQRYTFRQYGAAEGLSNLSVICLLQDRTGYIWAGTENGLFRYDGSAFRSYGLADGLPSMEILALAEAPDGSVWAATRAGVARSVGNQFKKVAGGKPATVRNVKFDDAGRVYLVIASGVVEGALDGLGSYRFSMIAPGVVLAMALSDDGLWFSRDDSLWRLQRGKPERFGTREGLPSDSWQAIARDSLGNLWARSFTRLYELPRGKSKFVDRSEGIPHATVIHLDTDSRGRLYVATNLGGIVISGTARTYIDEAHGLPGNTVETVFMDRDESLWIGMQGMGLVRRLGRGEWSSWKKEEGLLHNIVWSTLHHRNGTLWVGTSGGLSIFDAKGKLTHHWNTNNGLLGDEIDAILESPPGGDVFIAQYPGGVSRFTPEGRLLRNYGANAGLTPTMSVLAIDHNNRLWVAGEGACYRSRTTIDGRQNLDFERISIPGVKTGTTFTGIAVTQDGLVWIASSNGLIRFNGTGWRIFTEADGLKADSLSGIAVGWDALYVAYRAPLGFTRLQMQGEHVKTTHITREDGLSSDLVYAMAVDAGGRLWASTDSGVNVLEQGLWRRYGEDNGLIWDDCDSRAMVVDQQNDVWIGTSGGLSRFAPLPYNIPSLPPAVVLSSIQGGTTAFQPDDQPALPHAQNSLLLRFSGLNYADETHPRFRYRLLGHETAWHETRERSIGFAGLSAGHYVFEVNALAPNGMISPNAARFVFSVKRAWWQAWWFLILCVLSAVALTRAIWKFRMRVLLRQKNALEHQVAQRTGELRESHRKLEELAYYDTLTSLPNRRMYADQLRTRLELARQNLETFAMLLIDLDRFKYVNDTFGHDVGDAVLVETAARLKAVVRQSDCLARLGGDEFAILLNSAEDVRGIESACRRILESFASGIDFKGEQLPVGCSVGVAIFDLALDTQELLYKAADTALYEAKRMGRGRYAFYRSPEEKGPASGEGVERRTQEVVTTASK